jgi:type II secretory pathway pseudopilin PulG
MNIFDFKNKNNEKGFTLIEAMISVGLFTVVMIIGITAILGVNNTYRKARTMRSAIDNLNFIMEDMARNIRLGHTYRCVNGPGDLDFTVIDSPQDGEDCDGIVFQPFWSPIPTPSTNYDNKVIYYIDGEEQSIFKGMQGGANFFSDQSNSTALPMNSVDVRIDASKSYFSISGTSENDLDQPMVLIVLSGTVSVAGNETSFNLQTTVSQRSLDIMIE